MLQLPILVEAVATLTAAAIGSGVAAATGSFIQRYLKDRTREVVIRLSTGEKIKLELDKRVPQSQASELVMAAVRSAQAGDVAGLQRTKEASHIASQEARAAAS